MPTTMPLPYCIYVLLSLKDHDFYVGYTTDLPRRLDEHFQGRNTSTAPRRPFVLIFCEFYPAKADAARRETYLKTAKGRRTLRLMLHDSLVHAMAQQVSGHQCKARCPAWTETVPKPVAPVRTSQSPGRSPCP